jgi:DNA-binding MarR family transcriptional regulator
MMKNTAQAKQADQPDASLMDDVAEQCLLTRTRTISRVITSIYDNELRPYGLTSSQFSLLVRIVRMKGASRAELARASHQERSTSTRNLQVVLNEGWAEEVMPEKGRSRPIKISAAGTELLNAAGPAWRAAQVKANRLLGEQGVAALVGLAAGLPPE